MPREAERDHKDGALMGFHRGELAVQQQAGVRAEAARLVGMLEAPDLRGGASRFLAERTFVALTARDAKGRLWVTQLTGAPGLLDVQAARVLRVASAPGEGDPLYGLPAGQPVGLLVIDFGTRRRIRVNGTLRSVGRTELTLSVDEAYGNCPQFIQRRVLEAPPFGGLDSAAPTRSSGSLTVMDLELITRADTFVLGTTHPERGVDASHRGGPPGFVRVGAGGMLWWPDYAGNNMFNSLGNLAEDPTAALVFADFATGDTLHLSGTAVVEWTRAGLAGDDGGTGRRVVFHLESAVAGPPLALRAAHVEPYQRNPLLTDSRN